MTNTEGARNGEEQALQFGKRSLPLGCGPWGVFRNTQTQITVGPDPPSHCVRNSRTSYGDIVVRILGIFLQTVSQPHKRLVRQIAGCTRANTGGTSSRSRAGLSWFHHQPERYHQIGYHHWSEEGASCSGSALA